MLVRLRSTSIALLGVVTAIGLGLVAFISQLGWPGIVNSPIPNGSNEAGSVHSAVALTQGPVAAPAAPRRALRLVGPVASGGQAAAPTAASGRGGSRQVNVAAVGQSPAAVAQPLAAAAPTPTRSVEPQTTSSAPSPPSTPVAAVAETPQAGVATPIEDPKAVKPKPSGPTTTKVDGDDGESKPDEGEESKPDAPSSQPRHGEDDKGKGGSHQGPAKSGYSDKPDASGAAAPVVTAPPSTTPAKTAPEVGASGSDKEAWDAGKSDKRHH